ncbi:TPA: hypothetical protein ACLBZV_005318 [Bacillus cereus]
MNKYTSIGFFGGIKNDSLEQMGEQEFTLVLKHLAEEGKVYIHLGENIINYGSFANDYDKLTKRQQSGIDQEIRQFIKHNKAVKK